MDLFKKEDNVDKFWRLLCKQLDKDTTTPDNLMKRLYSAPLSSTAKHYFSAEENHQFLNRYGAAFFEKISTALQQGRINRSIAQMLLRDHGSISSIEEHNIQDDDLNRAVVHFNATYLKDLIKKVEKPNFSYIASYWSTYNRILSIYEPALKSEDAYNLLITAVFLSEKINKEGHTDLAEFEGLSEQLYKTAIYGFSYVKPELKEYAAKILLIEARGRRKYCVHLCDAMMKDPEREDMYKALFSYAIESQALPRQEVALLAELGARYFDLCSTAVTVSDRQLVADKGRDIDVLCVAFNSKAEKGCVDYYLRHRSLPLSVSGGVYKSQEATDLREMLTKLYPNKADELYDALSKSLSRNRVIGKQII